MWYDFLFCYLCFFFFLKLCCCYYTHAHSLTYTNFYFCAFVLLPHNSLICRFIYRFFIVSVIHNFIDFFLNVGIRYSCQVKEKDVELISCFFLNFYLIFFFTLNIEWATLSQTDGNITINSWERIREDEGKRTYYERFLCNANSRAKEAERLDQISNITFHVHEIGVR